MEETTKYDVYADVDGVEGLVGCFHSLDEIKCGITDFNEKNDGTIVDAEGFSSASNIGALESFANIRIDVRSSVEA